MQPIAWRYAVSPMPQIFTEELVVYLTQGYAFIQYDDQMDAINAVLSQDGQMLAGQAIGMSMSVSRDIHYDDNAAHDVTIATISRLMNYFQKWFWENVKSSTDLKNYYQTFVAVKGNYSLWSSFIAFH